MSCSCGCESCSDGVVVQQLGCHGGFGGLMVEPIHSNHALIASMYMICGIEASGVNYPLLILFLSRVTLLISGFPLEPGTYLH